MTDWHSIDNAPKDGQLILTTFQKMPVFAAWSDANKDKTENGWRLLMLTRDVGYGIHGNYGPVHPESWLPITKQQIESVSMEAKDG